ncbi:MAG: tetratricopeptide repeat protein, partial [Pirellulaceae bacterium]
MIVARLSLMHDSANREERLEILAKACEPKRAHPILRQMYAQDLSLDGRETSRAIAITRRAIRSSPLDPHGYQLLAQLLWDRNERLTSARLFRFSTCLDDKNEQFADSYFQASRSLRQTDVALDYLRNRCQRWLHRSSLPARTLFSALQRLERSPEALGVLADAIDKRPTDGSLKLFAARAFLATSLENREQAHRWLEEARAQAPPTEWLHTAAYMASVEGEPRRAVDYYRQVLRTQPTSVQIHASLAATLADSEGRDAALAFLAEAVATHPKSLPLWNLRCQWLSDEPTEVREPIIRQGLELHPDNAWLRRELGFLLAEVGKLADATQEWRIAHELEPLCSASFRLRAISPRRKAIWPRLAHRLRRFAALSVDDEGTIRYLLDLAADDEQRRAELALVRDELQRQVIFGEGLIAFRRQAARVLDGHELLQVCRDALDHRPDLWQTWSAYIAQCMATNDLEQAWATALEATDRFPLMASLWVDRAAVARTREDWAGQSDALETAYRMAPTWDSVILELKEVRIHRGDFAGARRLIELAISHDPYNVLHQFALAQLLWDEARRDATGTRAELEAKALQYVEQAIRIQPGFDDAWDALLEWSAEAGREELPSQVAQELVAKRPSEPRSYYYLGRMLSRKEELAASLAAFDRAIELNPRYVDAYQLKAQRLAHPYGYDAPGDYDGAIAACSPAAFGGEIPTVLRITRAEVQHQFGKVELAIEELQAILRAEPGNVYGWYKLALWQRDEGHVEKFRDAASNLVKLAPHNGFALGLLGEAHLAAGDNELARPLFERAFALNPAHEFAANELIDYYLERKDIARAGEVADRIGAHVQSPYLANRQIRVAIQREDRDEAKDKLLFLCFDENGESLLEHAVRALEEANWHEFAAEVLLEAARDPRASAHALTQWGALSARREPTKYPPALVELCERGERECNALYGFLSTLAHAQDASAGFRLLRDHDSIVRRFTLAWGSALYFYFQQRDWYSLNQLAADWRHRPDREDWMLVSVAEGLLQKDLQHEAREAILGGLAHGVHSYHGAFNALAA